MPRRLDFVLALSPKLRAQSVKVRTFDSLGEGPLSDHFALEVLLRR